MTLEKLIHELIADAFAAGVEWHTARIDRITAARDGLPVPPWNPEQSYQATLRRIQTRATKEVLQALVHLRRSITELPT